MTNNQNMPSVPAVAPRFANLATAAQITGVSTRSIRRYIDAGRITGYRIGPRMIRIDLNELQDMLTPIPTGIEASA